MKMLMVQTHTDKFSGSKISGVVPGTEVTLGFDSEHNGSYKSVVPMSLPGHVVSGTAKRFPVLVGCRIRGENLVNKRKETRILVQVATQYQAIKPEAEITTDTSPSEFQDQTRSKGEITAHIVLSIPKNATDDLNGLNGVAARVNARAQIAAAVRMLCAAYGSDLSPASELQLAPGSEEGDPQVARPSTVMFVDYHSGNNVDPVDGAADTPTAYAIDAKALPRVATLPLNTSFGSMPGLYVDVVDRNARELSTPLGRALNGLDPIGEDSLAILAGYSTDVT